jgi:hypothetical protein
VLAFLSLGRPVPMAEFLPRAGRLRTDLALMAAQDALTWVDVSAPGDGCCYALCDPVAVSGVAPPGKRWPLVMSAAFSQTLRPGNLARTAAALLPAAFPVSVRLRCNPGDYDYFRITAGPRALAGTAGASPRPAATASVLSPHTGARRHDRAAAQAARAARPRVAVALSAAVSARYPVGPAGAALSRLDGRVPHAVLSQLLCNDPALVRLVLQNAR